MLDHASQGTDSAMKRHTSLCYAAALACSHFQEVNERFLPVAVLEELNLVNEKVDGKPLKLKTTTASTAGH